MLFKDIVTQRHSVKNFDGVKILDAKIDELLEMIRLAPTSFNIQPWKVKIIVDQDTKESLKKHSWNQPQVTTCSHLLVFCANTDLMTLVGRLEKSMLGEGADPERLKKFMAVLRDFVSGMNESETLSWCHRQVYLALANGMNGAKALGFDSSALEGFIPEEYAKILNLPKHLVPSVLLAVGYTGEKPRPKTRFSKTDMFF